MQQTVRWKLDDDIYKQLARMMGELYDLSKDSTNLVSYYNAMIGFYLAGYGLMKDEDKPDIVKEVNECKKVMRSIWEIEGDTKTRIEDDRPAISLRMELWDKLQDLYLKISESHIKKGLYGDTSTKYDAFNAGAEFGE